MADEEKLRAQFDYVDADGNGLIDMDEFRGLLERLGLQRSQGIMEVAFQAIDLDDSGAIDFDEFKAWFESAFPSDGDGGPSVPPEAH